MLSMLNRGWGLPYSSLRSNLSLIRFYLSPSACMALVLLSFSVNVLAVSVELTSEGPPNYHYSVTIIDPGYYNMLKERVNGGSWVAAQASDTSGNTFTFHYKLDGKYEYRVQYCRDYSDFYTGCQNFSSTITVVVGPPLVVRYGYDELGRLTSVSRTRSREEGTSALTNYEYDDVGNRLEKQTNE